MKWGDTYCPPLSAFAPLPERLWPFAMAALAAAEVWGRVKWYQDIDHAWYVIEDGREYTIREWGFRWAVRKSSEGQSQS